MVPKLCLRNGTEIKRARCIGTGTGRGHPHIGIARYLFWRMPDVAQLNGLWGDVSPAAGQIWACEFNAS